jgi:lysophospholipase-3
MKVPGASTRSRFAPAALAAALLLGAVPATVAAAEPGLTPIVIFPAFHFTRLEVVVDGQTVDPACPSSGSFEDWFPNPATSAFSQVCQDKLLTLRYRPHGPFRERFSNQRGVTVRIADYGRTESAPVYEPMYLALEAAGYTRNEDVRVAGYDSRLTPDIGNFLRRTKRLIEDTYLDNGRRPVHLTGHSNGPIYAQWLLTHTSAAWKHKHIHGFSPLAGNFPGQGGVYPLFFTGLNVATFTFPTTVENAISSARMYLSAPSTYVSSADPRIFGDIETVIEDQSTGNTYTPEDFRQLFRDAGVPWARDIAVKYIGGVPFANRANFPNVDVYAEKGSGLETLVGMSLPDLTIGQLIGPSTTFFTRDGDINQEDITNDAVGAWSAMRCFHFSLTDNPGVDHFALPNHPDVIARLIANANAPRSDCDED